MMREAGRVATAFMTAATTAIACRGHARAQEPADTGTMSPAMADHGMWTAGLGGGWSLVGMAQAFPVLTVGAPGEEGSPLHETEAYVTQAATMADVASPGHRWVLRATLNFEGLTQDDGELSFGAWGEGFIDRRHPHTLLHELVLSLNLWDAAGGSLSLSGGKGFAPFGTDDPMGRPGLKYPTNHHLSQILERWLVAGAFLRGGWSAEAGLFGGAEPEGPYDFGNAESFADSWSARVARRWGPGDGPMARWEASASYAGVLEEVAGMERRVHLWNVALRHSAALGGAHVYGLVEASLGDPEGGDPDFSALAESAVALQRHRPYLRVEYARRPEFPREAGHDEGGFFRYEHHDAPTGSTRWLIATAGYGYDLTSLPLSVRPFVDTQYHAVRADRGSVNPAALFGTESFWSLSFGARVFLGGEPMRMGAYGVLDPMIAGHAKMGAGPMEMPMEAQQPAWAHR